MLTLEQVEKIVGQKRAVWVESLSVQPGDIVVIVGASESGPSLLLRLISGHVAASSGTLWWDGHPLTGEIVRHHVGQLFEEDLLYERLTVRQNLVFACDLWKVSHDRIDVALAQVGLNDHHTSIVRTLTPPLQRRLAFARLLVRPTEVWLLDTPSARTDAETRSVLGRLIQEVAATGTMVIMREEDLSWAGKLATRVLEFEGAHLIEGYPVTPTSPRSQQHTPYKISARQEDRIVLYDPGDVLYITSTDGKTMVKTMKEEATTPLTLQELEARLQGRGFFRAHRAYLVNLQHIKAVIQFTRNSYTLLLNDGTESQIPLSKNAEKELQERLGY